MTIKSNLQEHLSGLKEHAHSMSDEEKHVIFLASFLGIMVFFFLGAAFIEKYKPKVGHETGATILVGMFISYLFWLGFGDANAEMF
jgi:predicted permease